MNAPLISRADLGEFRRRYRVMALIVIVAFGVVVYRLFQLQILDGSVYERMARDNVVRRVVLPTTRGVVRDSQSKIVASSRPAYNVYVVPGRVLPSSRPKRRGKDPIDTWPRVVSTLRLNPDEKSRIEGVIRTACATDEDNSPCFRHRVLVREDVARDIVAEIRQHQSELAGAELVAVPVRYYPFKQVGSHTIGHLAEIDAETLQQIKPPGYETMSAEERLRLNPLLYDVGDVLGATGIERGWESYLRGQRGWEKRVVDARGHTRNGSEAEGLIEAPLKQEPTPGRDLKLSLDMDLVQTVDKAMRPHAAGAVVVTEVRTGRVLALYSKPEFDPNELSGGNGRARIREAFARLTQDPLRPLLDKTVTGAFQPGSTFKPFSALAVLEDKLLNPEETERCDGFLRFGRKLFRCTHVHGPVDMKDALAASCNIYFAKVAEAAGMDRIAHIATEFGMGEKTGIGVNPESPGRVPTRAWYASRYRGQFRLGFTINMAVGQGATAVTPLQLALAYGAIANGGTVYSPQLVRAVETSDGQVVQEFPPRVRHQADVKPENLARIQAGLYAVVNDPKGTAYPVRDPSLEVAGKTGTAQTGYIQSPNDDAKLAWYYAQNHAWFAAYAPAAAPEVAVVVLVEHGGAGPTQAAPVALAVLKEYFRLRSVRGSARPQGTDPNATGSARPQGTDPNATGSARPQGTDPNATGSARPQGTDPNATGSARPQGTDPNATGSARPQGTDPNATGSARPQGAGP